MNQISGDLNTVLDIFPSLVQDNLVQCLIAKTSLDSGMTTPNLDTQLSAFQTLLQNWTKDAKIS